MPQTVNINEVIGRLISNHVQLLSAGLNGRILFTLDAWLP